jgi:glutathione synthase/RimK-type ligase-like ATP-grasp enzyme
MLARLREFKLFKRITKEAWYARLRGFFPMPEPVHLDDDREFLDNAVKVLIEWPEGLPKPVCGVIKDFEPYPRWTKVVRFLENNGFSYEIYDLHAHDWLEKARKFDIIIGIVSNYPYHLDEMRRKYFILEECLGKRCYPSTKHIMLYENKTLEAYISEACNLPFARTYISNKKEDALHIIAGLHYPVVHKVDPGSGSVGVELVRDEAQARKIVNQAFSRGGRPTHNLYYNQKNTVYFQDFVANDGFDVRVIITGNSAFGYYRKVLPGDFRASGMNTVEKRELPEEAIRVAWRANQVIQSPLLVVDMLHGPDDSYTIIEFSPTCQMELPEQLHDNNNTPGVYRIDPDGCIHFEPLKVWVHELALREFLVNDYLPRVMKPPRIANVKRVESQIESSYTK